MPAGRKASVLHAIGGLLGRQVSTDKLLRAMVETVVRAVDAERGTLFLLDPESGELVSRVALLPELKEIRLPAGKGVAGYVAATGRVLQVPDAAADGRFFPGVDELTGFRTRSLLAVPVLDGSGRVIGVLQVLNKKGGHFGDTDTELLTVLAGQIADTLARTLPTAGGMPGEAGPFNRIIGKSPLMQELYRRVLAAAQTDVTVLLRGETGTGKNLIARAIHDNSARAGKPLVIVDCTTLPAGLMESELFGHERGAFTGAVTRARGKVEMADGGTLLVDEVGDLSLELQGKLLRLLQERTFERLGSERPQRADVRLISATNADLAARVKEGAFRRDLYYRLRVLEIEVPPLRRRGREDILLLARHFLSLFAERHRRPARRFSREAEEKLVAHHWPGNVRELEHCIEAAVVTCPGEQVAAVHLAIAGDESQPAGYPPGTRLDEVVRDHILRTLESCGGNRLRAARLLGIGRNTLARKLKSGR